MREHFNNNEIMIEGEVMDTGKTDPAEKTNASRRGEKIGWTLGWLGGFIWLLLLSVLWLIQKRTTEGFTGLALFVLAVVMILHFAPWRHPTTRYWKLMVPVYLVFLISVGMVVWSISGLEEHGLNWWSFFWVLPCLTPLGTLGGRRWQNTGK